MSFVSLNIWVDQNLSYREALRIAYDNAKREGELDPVLEADCQFDLNSAGPASIYHESNMINDLPQPDLDKGITHYKPWGLREIYEQAKINARRGRAEFLEREIRTAADEIKNTIAGLGPEWERKQFSLKIDESGSLKSISAQGGRDVEKATFLTGMLNQNDRLKLLAVEYGKVVKSLIHCTIAGLNAPYACFFEVSKETDEATVSVPGPR